MGLKVLSDYWSNIVLLNEQRNNRVVSKVFYVESLFFMSQKLL